MFAFITCMNSPISPFSFYLFHDALIVHGLQKTKQFKSRVFHLHLHRSIVFFFLSFFPLFECFCVVLCFFFSSLKNFRLTDCVIVAVL